MSLLRKRTITHALFHLRSWQQNQDKECAQRFLRFNLEPVYQGLNALLKNNPWCEKCDGLGYYIKKDFGAGGSDEDVICDCGQDGLNTPQPLTPAEQASIKMYNALVEIKDHPNWSDLDTALQDKISSALHAGKNLQN